MTDLAARFEQGRNLAFVIGAFRSGTTLLRKVLDTHPAIHSPAETWFLLPLLNLWDGAGEHRVFNPRQAAAAMKTLISQDQFLSCARAFAGRLYASSLRPGAMWYVDKTPLYLLIAPVLAALFPEARFIVLARDPRAILWSRHTWKHLNSTDPAKLVAGVAQDIQALASFYTAVRDRSILVSYERLCEQPAEAASTICSFLDLPFHPAMTDYGASRHHEGYGDDLSRRHFRPHENSIARWQGNLAPEVEAQLLNSCGEPALNALGYALSSRLAA